MAMVSVLPSRCARTAAETPTPPTASPASPISTRKSASRSTKRSMPGAPFRRSRHCRPVSAKRASASRCSAGEVRRRVEPQAVGGIEERSFDQQPAAFEVGQAHDHPRPEAEAGGPGVRLGQECVGEAEVGGAEADHVAGGEPQPVDQHPVGHQPRQPVADGERRGQGAAAGELHLSVERIGVVDRLHLHQRALGLRARPWHRRHGAEVDDLRYRERVRRHEGALGFVGEAVGELDLGVAAEQRRGLVREARLDRGAHRAHRRDRRHPERQAGDEDAEAGEPAAQLAQGQAGRDRKCRKGAFQA